MAAWKNPTTAPKLGVVGRANTGSVFDLQQWQPSAAAAVWVENFWSVTWDLRDAEPFDSTVITFPAVHLTHEWGTDEVRHGHRLPATLVHGVVERVFTTTLSGAGSVVGARFRPGGFAARFGRDAGALTGRVLPVGAELLGAAVPFANDIDRAAAALDAAIGNHTDVDATYRDLTRLLDRVRADSQLHRVEQVMALSPWSERTTQRVFRRYVGVPVKWVLCRYRLQHAALQIETVPDLDFADLAVRLGWYDQAHFINDFHAMLGCTPGEYATKHRR
ncbi:transcriptional regulator [Mycolicibacterium sp. TY66]|uniref:AraC family transcriptional regulator n=1 Tax=unclassified Mycolicibacterium TaxID=2636767 RepID=UPI001BB3E11C|nr:MULTISPECIES: helix-turn-helix domain-containing protein [unclassified Mycolicibacterium]BCI83240.1 transcriptional regulator [Mycolicibacterium sp. TY66]BCJ79114.1 transcriptional regulator [Mycolicibacterium sp. TY81]